MIQYIVNVETKTIELQNNGTMQELKDLYELYKDYKFTTPFPQKENNQGVTAGCGFVSIIGKINNP